MSQLTHSLVRPLCALTACLAFACAPDADRSTGVDGVRSVTLGLSLSDRDGAGFVRDVVFEEARLDETARTLTYLAWVDGRARTLTYADDDGALRITATDGHVDGEVSLLLLADRAEFSVAGQLIGHFLPGEDTHIRTFAGSDPLSFALLSFFPHAIEGLEPEVLFPVGGVAEVGDGISETRVGLRLFGLQIGQPKVRCKRVKVKINTCQHQCTQTSDGCACGGQCGAIACCQTGCVNEEKTEWDYGGSI